MTAKTLHRDLIILNQRGLHARAAAKLVRMAQRFNADLKVIKDGTTVPGTSIMGLMMLAATKGSSIRLTASGPDSAKAIKAIAKLVADKFEED